MVRGDWHTPRTGSAVPTADETYRVAVAAGIGVAAHVRLFDDPDVEADSDELQDTGRRNHDRLTPRPLTLFGFLDKGEADPSPAKLRELAESAQLPDRDQLEARAFAFLIDDITEDSN